MSYLFHYMVALQMVYYFDWILLNLFINNIFIVSYL